MARQRPRPARAVQAVQIARGARAHGILQKRSEFAPFLAIVLALKPTTVVEIGRGSGGSLWALCRAAAQDATIISVDLPDGPFGGRDDSKTTIARLRAFAGPSQHLQLIQADSHDRDTASHVARITPTVDLLFIDGDHTYEGVKTDYELYSPLVRPGGLIAFHDILHHPAVPESQVDRFWNELNGAKRAITSPSELQGYPAQWGGIGILIRS